MRSVKDLGSRPAPANFLQVFRRLLRGQGPAIPVERRQIPFWQERGWKRTDNVYEGSYQTAHGAFQGWIEQERSGRLNFYLFGPTRQIRDHSHWICFQHRGHDWYMVHMHQQPRDVSSGIMTIERLITEAHQKH
jgi:hypothetical protein